MKLSQGNAAKLETQGKKSHKGSAISGSMDKLKASNFPASILQIGSWEVYCKFFLAYLFTYNRFICIQFCLLHIGA